MATADLEFSMSITGTPEEVASILNIMVEYAEGKDGVYFSMTHFMIDGTDHSIHFTSKDDILAAAANSSGPVGISSCGPFGRYGALNDVDIFRDMAEAAPNASFEASISGFAGYADQSLNAKLADQRLYISTYYLSDDVRGEAELQYIYENLPYETFIETFRLDPEEFTEEMYEEFVIDNIACMDSPAEFFEETGYEEFLEILEVECPLTEEEYAQIAQEFSVTEYEDFDEYLETGDFVCSEDFIYDPIEKKYIKGGRPMMKTNTAYDVTEEIREYLKSKDMPCDDETIANLSVEDVYDIMAGVYGVGAVAEESSEADESKEAACACEDDDCVEAKNASDTCAAEESEEAEEKSDSSSAVDAEEIGCTCDEGSESAQHESTETDTAPTAHAEQESAAPEACEDEVIPEADTAEPAVSEPEITVGAETAVQPEARAAAPKKSAPVWLIVLLIAIILIGLAAVVFGLGELLGTTGASLLNIIARLL